MPTVSQPPAVANLAALLEKASQVLLQADMAVQDAYRGTDGSTLHMHARYTHSAKQGFDELKKDLDTREPSYFVMAAKVHSKDFNNGLFILECKEPGLRTEIIDAMKAVGMPVKEIVTGQVTQLLKTQLNAAGITSLGRPVGTGGPGAA